MQHLRGYGALDAEAMTAPFSDTARVVTPDRVYAGKAEVLVFMKDLVEEFSVPEISNETHGMTVDGNVVMLMWSAESPKAVYTFGVDTYLVEDGEIVLLTTAAQVEPK